MDNNPKAPFVLDPLLLFPALLLTGFGVVMVYSASSAIALDKFQTDFYFMKKQVIFALVGLAAMIGVRFIPYTFYRKNPYLILAVSMILLAAVIISGLGHTAGGAARWLKIGPVSFQPSEFARIAMVIYLAYSLDKKKERIREAFIGFIPHVVMLGFMIGIIALQPDFGSIAILAVLTWAMLFAGGVRLLHLVGSLVPFLPALYIYMISADYRIQRLKSFWDPWKYHSDEGYQIVHSLMAFGTGGIWGTGIGQGFQKLFYLPEPHTDFIFSVIGEETGLVGVLTVIMLYGIILWQGFKISIDAVGRFESLLAFGLTVSMGIQICINTGVSLGLLPAKGLALPFLSYGGSSMLMSMVTIGILMNIKASSYGTKEQQK